LGINESKIVEESFAGNFKFKIVVTAAIATISSKEDAPNIIVEIPFFLP